MGDAVDFTRIRQSRRYLEFSKRILFAMACNDWAAADRIESEKQAWISAEKLTHPCGNATSD